MESDSGDHSPLRLVVDAREVRFCALLTEGLKMEPLHRGSVVVNRETHMVVRKGRTVEFRSEGQCGKLWWMIAGGDGKPVGWSQRGENDRPMVIGVLLRDDELWMKVMREFSAGRRPGVERPFSPEGERVWPWNFGADASGARRRGDATVGPRGENVSMWLHLEPRCGVRLAVGLVEGELEHWGGGRGEDQERLGVALPDHRERRRVLTEDLRGAWGGKGDDTLVAAFLAQGSPLSAGASTPDLLPLSGDEGGVLLVPRQNTPGGCEPSHHP